MIYDTLVLIGIWVFTVVLLVTITGNAVVGWWVQSILFIEMFAFFVYFWVHRGQTLGMQAWRLRILCEEELNLRRAFLRFLGAIAGFVALFLGYFWILLDKQKRSWSDMCSDTYVVREPKSLRRKSSQPS